jgi:hypothetical protein
MKITQHRGVLLRSRHVALIQQYRRCRTQLFQRCPTYRSPWPIATWRWLSCGVSWQQDGWEGSHTCCSCASFYWTLQSTGGWMDWYHLRKGLLQRLLLEALHVFTCIALHVAEYM